MYQAPLKPSGQPRWYEVLRADDRNWAEYVAGLLHNACGGEVVTGEHRELLTRGASGAEIGEGELLG